MLPDDPAASVRDFCSGAYTRQRRAGNDVTPLLSGLKKHGVMVLMGCHYLSPVHRPSVYHSGLFFGSYAAKTQLGRAVFPPTLPKWLGWKNETSGAHFGIRKSVSYAAAKQPSTETSGLSRDEAHGAPAWPGAAE